MRAMVGVNARIAHRRRRHRTRASFRLGPWVVLAVLVSLVVPGAFAAPFADRTALKAAVDSCITLDPTGVACCNHGADCGAAGPVEMPDWDVSQVTSMSELFYDKGSFNADISRWDSASRHVPMFECQAFNQDIGHGIPRRTSMHRVHDPTPSTRISVHGIPRASRPWSDVLRHQGVQPGYRYMGHLERHDHVPDVLRDARAFNQDIGTWDTSSVTTMDADVLADAFNQHLSRWDVSSVTTMRKCSIRQRIQHHAGGLGHIQSHGFILICFILQPHGRRGLRAAVTHPPRSGWTRKDNACDASYPPVNGAVGTCTDTLVSGTSCVPDVRRRVSC